ncbi:MAG: hypothetical protein AAF318_13190 [Pseudomonadota bacterium]
MRRITPRFTRAVRARPPMRDVFAMFAIPFGQRRRIEGAAYGVEVAMPGALTTA